MPSVTRIPVFIATLFLTACASPAYYWQATTGHLELMSQRRAVDDMLADPATEPALRERLAQAGEILEFADRQLGLPAGGSYRSYVEAGGPVTWNVIATPPYSLQPKRWCFPVAGCVAYRGYFERDKALAFAGRLEKQGLDVAVLPAAAYSTLGWFEDPLLDTMLERDPEQLAGTLFHELAHQRLYLNDDTAFNEGYASYVEAAGVAFWLEGQAGADQRLAAWRQGREAAQDFDALLRRARAELKALYAGGREPEDMATQKAAAFARLRQRYQDLVDQTWNGRAYFSGWMQHPLNNAHLAAFSAYAGGRCAFDGLMLEAGGDFPTFHALAEAAADTPRAERRAWLDQACPAVASGPEL